MLFALRPVADVVVERGTQPEIVERRRAKLPDQLLDVAIELPGGLFERLDRRRHLRAAVREALQTLDAPCQCRELLAELVVHLARDPPPLVFLREHESRQPFSACLLGALSFSQRFRFLPRRQIEVCADDAHDRTARGSSDGKAAREDVDVLTVLVAKPELSFVDLRASLRGSR